MALAADLINLGVNRRTAAALGLAPQSAAGNGVIQSTATAITDSICLLSTTGGNTAFVLPKCPLSKTGLHFMLNTSGVTAVVFVGDTATETISVVGGGTGAATYVEIPKDRFAIIIKLSSTAWAGLTTA